MITKQDVEIFCNTCSFLKHIYDHFYYLYEQNEMRLQLLEEAGGFFFVDLQYVFIEYLIVQVYKITDGIEAKTKQGCRHNLTIKFFVEYADLGKDQSTVESLSEDIHLFRSKIEFARNKRAAHIDRLTALENINLGFFTRNEFAAFLNKLEKFLDIIHRRYVGGPYNLAKCHDAEGLIQALKYSQYYKELAIKESCAAECYIVERISPYNDA